MMQSLSLIAPAKLNLFLHINGRRPDGYHELETLFIFLDYGDRLDFTLMQENDIQISGDCNDILLTDNLIYKAARALQTHTGCSQGVHIQLTKRLPMGGGVGGGSSDAASTLLALNTLWQLKLPLETLAEIGLQLGADVPVFVRGQAALAHGVGEQLEPVTLPKRWYLVVHPNQHVSTCAIFTHPDLTRNTPKLKADWQSAPLRNDCEPLVKKLCPEVEKTLDWLLKYAPSKMTGTGACCFAEFHTQEEAKRVLDRLPTQWHGFIACSANLSPAHAELEATMKK